MRAHVNPSVAVLGTGSCLGGRTVTNEDLRPLIRNYDESSGDFSTWVDRVTHIHERPFVVEGETAATLGIEAGGRALEMAGIRAIDLDLIVHCSFTPSAILPGDHVLLAKGLGADRTPSFALTAACAGSLQGMALAYGMIASGAMRRVMVVGTETISPVIDYGDPLTAILFGDGAGAVVLGAVNGGSGGMLPPHLGFEFNLENITMGNANLPYSSVLREPAGNGTPALREQPYLRMRAGPSILRNAVQSMAGAVRTVLGYEREDDPAFRETLRSIRLVPHQANGRIVDGLAKRLGLEPRQVTKTIYKVGNMSAASNLIALDFAMRRGNLVAERDPATERILSIREVEDPIRKGELVVLPSIGAGYLFGAVAFLHRS